MFQQDISKRKSGTVENGLQIFLLTATGEIKERKTGEYKTQRK